ncbi:MAG: amidohydrolase family protein [Acidobacteria bacterium]|nr:amidohydrolase family protein [Acidobacteriota bacterium]
MINHSASRALWTADWVCPGPGETIPGGAVVVEDGRVLAVGESAALRQAWPEAPALHRGAAVLPLPANTHTHLDLTLCPAFHGSYEGFVRHMLACRDRRGADGARAGLARLRWHRTGAVGDVVASPAAMEVLLAEAGLPGTVYWEVIAPDPGQAEARFRDLRAQVDAWRRREGRLRVGLSPHAAHTVSAPLLRRIGEYARAEDIPLQIHAAETPEEVIYFREGKGPLRNLMREITGKPWKRPGMTPVAWLAELGVLGPGTAVVHAVHAEASDARLIAQAGASVIACPRSNAALGTGPFPWERFREAGVPVALGTDSTVTAGDLDVMGELRRLWGSVPPEDLLRAACCDGYRVLGLEPPSLAPGTPLGQVKVLEVPAPGADAAPPTPGRKRAPGGRRGLKGANVPEDPGAPGDSAGR